MTQEKKKVEFWVLNNTREVIHRTDKKHRAAAFVVARGCGDVVKVKPVRLPAFPR